MYESPVNVIYGEMQTQIEGDIFKAIQNVGIDVNKEELLKALQYDRRQYEKGHADGYAKAIDKEEDLNLLISEFCVRLGIETICEELSDWDLDEEDETWCSRNCGVTNSGNCPEKNCYKEWIRMKKAGEENEID